MATQDELRDADLIVAAPDAVIRGLSPTRSFASDSTSRLDPATLISKRSHHRRNFTRNVNKVKMVIHETGPSIYSNDLITKANDHYEQCMYYHHRYCAKLGVTDDTWLENLRHDYNTAHEEFATARRPGHDTEQPAPRATTRTRAQVRPGSVESTRQPEFAPLDVPVSTSRPGVVESTRQPESASRGVPTSTSHHSREEDVSRTEVVVDPVSDSHHQAEGSRPSSLASSRSSVAASISSSHRSRSSTLSALTRERLAAELDLELARKRREEEKNENDLLDELARKLREEKIRIGAKRKERKIEEEIARLRMNEKLSKRSVRSPSPTSLSSYSEPDDDIHIPLPKSKPRDKVLLPTGPSDKSADSWIDDLEQKPTALPAAAPMPWMFGGSAPFTCRTPFDGDPRDWLLFASRFRALVHDVIPNDAQRLAILTEWVGPSVFRRISPLLKAPRGYTAVLAYLKKHYGSSEQIARCQIHDLLSLPFVKPGDRQALESFSDQLHGAVVVLEQGGLEHDLKSAANLDQAVQKLPPVFRHRWARYARKRLPKGVDLSDLDRFMEEERMARSAFELAPKVDVREKRVTFPKPAVEKHPSSRPAILKPPPVRPPPTILATQVAKDVDVECPGCGGAHRLVSCPELQRKSPSERALVAKEKGVCFNCLGGKHRSADCRSKPACESTGCRARHHSLLHGAERVFPEKSTPRQFPSSAGGQECFQGPQTLAIAPRLTSDVLLAVVPVRLRAGCRTLDVFALLDTGSQATLLREDAANALGLTGRPRKIRFGTFHGNDPVVETRLVGFSVSSLEGDQNYKVSDAFVVPRLNVGQRKIKDVLASFDYLRDLNFPARDAGEVQILIGMDVQDAHLNIEVRRPPSGVRGPNAVLTPFGWCVVGRTYPLPAVEDPSINFVKLGTIEQLEECVERFWKTQSLPVRDAPSTFMSSSDRAAMDQLESTIRHTGTRYEVGLPVRPHCPKLPDNKEFARRKFFALERRLLLHNDLRQAVTAQMKEVFCSGHAVKVTSTAPGSKVWFLPYHPVRHPTKPSKIRLVYDAAARFKGTAINDILLKGPDLTTQLLAVLLRFRERRIGVTADIAKMFYQVLVRESDCTMFRFLWREPGTEDPIQEFQMTVHIFGAVSSPTVCSFALQRLEKDAPEHLKEVARRIRSSFYVDNLLSSFDEVDEGVSISQKLVELLKLGGFDLVQFLSSSRSLLDQLPSSSRLVPELDLDFDDLPTERTLGYLWSCERDEFVFRFKKTEEAFSKRSILSAISSIYDPLGLLAPVVLVAKIILQDIWRLKGGWDEILPADILNRWGRFVEHLPMLELLNIPRSFLTSPQSAYRSFQLHAFSDASKDGFGVVIYLRAETSGEVEVSFVMAKVRVAPIHQLSIPKMELQGALLAVRLANYLLKELTLPISNVFFWVDAMTVVRWIHASHRRYNVFVANRIAEILDSTTPSQWRHVPGALNPADECSRGLCPSELDPNHRWYRGPEFLVLPPEQWPAQIPATELIDHEDESIGCFLIANPSGPVDDVVARADNLHRLIRIAAWIERFVRNIQILVHRRRARERSILDGNHEEAATGQSEQLKTGRQQSADELKSARRLLIRVSQRDSFPDDLSSLRKAKSVRPESRLLKLSVYLDDAGIIRVGGRLENAPISAEARHPAVLEPKHPLTRLFIRWAHISVAHGRADRTLAEVRARYWVLKGREATKSVITTCLYCSRMRAKPFQPMMAPLPAERVQPFSPPFTRIGVDYLGPFPISIGRRTENRWIALFTCLSTRAIHLEITPSMDVDSFLMAFTRFVSRRGAPTDVFSDNGTNLTAGERELREAVTRLNDVKIADQLAQKEIRWHFSPPAAPHFGGVWERLVRSCKEALRAILGQQTVKEETFATVVIEVEGLLNNRPLTDLGADPQEFEPLTPNHFLLGRPNPHLPADVIDPEIKCFRRRWFHAQQIVDQVWSRWLREYLPTLTTRNKWTRSQNNLEVNDMVLMVDPKSPRGHWPICRVARVLPGSDGVVRAAEIITKSGKTFTRPVVRLCRLEALSAA
ncbi:uncharacterized protein LOC116934425 [Daphnia magna]|uniref:uncharacterized protein LOC116934425 n=1 Tax=Daphnia magna TaxID=35525 RepID=UPI001E1BB3F1|nr:uncharacterized protein LOC116934425 [Daphnia magna]